MKSMSFGCKQISGNHVSVIMVHVKRIPDRIKDYITTLQYKPNSCMKEGISFLVGINAFIYKGMGQATKTDEFSENF